MRNLIAILPTYVVWHYTMALRDLERNSSNLLWFIFHFFSVGVLLGTLFSPWKKLSKDESSHHPTFFSNLAVNVLMRVVGFFVRTITIVMGLICFIIGTFLFIALFVVWLFLPFLVVISFLYGVSFFITGYIL
ncbi:MAG: hypothetical protein A3H57_00665 [Candidatus Taylorbacteria bacterium RIFCSPLOWO2_02_FULL_43_11]|uniref:Uncharacterized protein n=1 Tax=Candidatus Taylorbacteria bacterium RIFCSPHIGHO2_02_FULL_43_32b TaxID=1802306 RepID=A0A1G2MIJ6_9BACT|nr:MAG: hypothetical protein A2743_04390 [Candidatus Taylorbacteria bacterium RIFCSPHIGHO2_01_FULL_43_47]OHA23683.1 MAG: hypothetical protein A3C72_00410 [Candidatus Taylorbacteria bacterium RIFCSPHIGHO2_02_FULL_43_32b]OHA30646.1 MAG: hypothetical protein A3B08_00435 [Candidatus Taylorbacteria bacterium RIFCSPLOWO2_01_FULL_43_44]OHA37180.1 MAG: hypothetical protein A3H57_00665 [Candidatus Taylorbacteria bacterium RIFCSPLOWO2_02_FULL_43_11]